MKVLIDASGNVLARYSDIFIDSVNPSVEPSQTIIDLPSDIIGEAVIHVTITEDASGNPIYTYTFDQASIDQLWRNIRLERNSRLSASDWICSVTDYVVANKSDWVDYRAALRILTQQPNPFRLVWPTAPASSVVIVA